MKTATPTERFWRVPLDSGEVVRTRGEVNIREERCKGCNFCVEFCPRDVLTVSTRFNTKGYHPPDISNADACTGCHLCEVLCPDFAIGVREFSYKDKDREVAHAC